MERFEFEAELKAKTDRALLVRPVDDDVEFWLPLSLVDGDIDRGSSIGESGFISIPRWLAKERGLLF